MNKTYRISLRSQMYIIKEFFKFLLAMVAGYFLLKWYLSSNDWSLEIITVSIFLLTCLIPSLIIHIQYLKYNKNMSLQVDADSRIMTISRNGSKSSFGFDMINKVEIELMTPLYLGQRGGIAPWNLYHYAAIEIEGDEKYFITCLLINDLRGFFTEIGVKAEKKRIFFPLILQYRHIDEEVWKKWKKRES